VQVGLTTTRVGNLSLVIYNQGTVDNFTDVQIVYLTNPADAPATTYDISFEVPSNILCNYSSTPCALRYSYYTPNPTTGGDTNGFVSCADVSIFSRKNDVGLTWVFSAASQAAMLPRTFLQRILIAFPNWKPTNPVLINNATLDFNQPFPLDAGGLTYSVTMVASDSFFASAADIREEFSLMSKSDMSSALAATVANMYSVKLNFPPNTYQLSIAFSLFAVAITLVACCFAIRVTEPMRFFSWFSCFPCCVTICCGNSASSQEKAAPQDGKNKALSV